MMLMNEKTNYFLKWRSRKKISQEEAEDMQKRKDKINELMKRSAISSGRLTNVSTSPLTSSTVWTGGVVPTSNGAINTIPPLSLTPHELMDHSSRKKPVNIFQEMLTSIFDKQEMVQYIVDNGGKIVDSQIASFNKGDMEIISDIHTVFYEMIIPKFKTMLTSKQVLKFKI